VPVDRQSAGIGQPPLTGMSYFGPVGHRVESGRGGGPFWALAKPDGEYEQQQAGGNGIRKLFEVFIFFLLVKLVGLLWLPMSGYFSPSPSFLQK